MIVRELLTLIKLNVGVTQLGEYHPFKMGVEGSRPSTRTTIWPSDGTGETLGT